MESYSHFVPKSPGRDYYVGTGLEVGLSGIVWRTEDRVRDNYHRGPASFRNPEMDMASLKYLPWEPKVEEEFVSPFISYPYRKWSVGTSQSLSALPLFRLLKAMVTSQKNNKKLKKKKKTCKSHINSAWQILHVSKHKIGFVWKHSYHLPSGVTYRYRKHISKRKCK